MSKLPDIIIMILNGFRKIEANAMMMDKPIHFKRCLMLNSGWFYTE